MTFEDIAVPAVPGSFVSLTAPYSQNGLTLTPTATGAPTISTHFDADYLNPGVGGEIHKGNDAESAKVEFSGGNFNLLSIDIVKWSLASGDSSLTLTFTGSNGSTHDVSYNFTGTIDFAALGGFTNIAWVVMSVPDINALCPPNGTGICSGVVFDNITVAGAETPLPAALPLFAAGLGALGVIGWRRKKRTALAR
jgi:hypothetical protein